MILYFNKKGVLKEVIDTIPTRQGSYDVNKVYAYFEESTVTSATFLSDQSIVESIVSSATNMQLVDNESASGIYVGDIDLKYFKLYKTYPLFVYTLSQADLTAGLRTMTIRGVIGTTILAQGNLVYNVESQVVQPDESIGKNEYDYLIARLASVYSKTEADTLLNAKVDKVTTTTNYAQSYIKAANGTQTVYDTDSQVINNAIVQRNNAGQVIVPTTPTDNAHATSKNYVDSGLSSKASQSDMTQAQTDIDSLEALVPSEATSSNKLVDKAYVDNKVEEYAPTFRGAFQTYAALIAYSGSKDKNDYSVVLSDETHSNQTSRYVYNGSEWSYEYKLSDSAMTEAQLAALNSGITSSKVSTYDGYASTKQDVLTAGSNISITDNVVAFSGTIPTKTSDLTNDSGFITNAVNDLTNYTTTTNLNTALAGKQNTLSTDSSLTLTNNTLSLNQATDSVLGGIKATAITTETDLVEVKLNTTTGKLYAPTIPTLSVEIVQVLPEVGSSGTIYLVPTASATSQNTYDEFIWVNNAWERLGGVSIDLTPYQTKADSSLTTTTQTVVGGINELNAGKQNATDNNLTTTDKTIVGAINELDSSKQDNLPTVTNDRYLHTNSSTGELEWSAVSVPVTDVQVNSTSILNNGVANIPYASANDFGVSKVDGSTLLATNGVVAVNTNTMAQKSDLPLVFSNPSVGSWSADQTYSDYGYKALVTTTGVTSDYTVMVNFSAATVTAGNIASFCETTTDGVYIWSSTNDAVTISNIVATKVV